MTRFIFRSIWARPPWAGPVRVPQDAARRPAPALSADVRPIRERIWAARRFPRPAAFPSWRTAARPERTNARHRPRNPPARTEPAPPRYRTVRTAYTAPHEPARLGRWRIPGARPFEPRIAPSCRWPRPA